MLYVTKNHKRWGGWVAGYFALTLLGSFVHLEASTSCSDICRCNELENGPDTTVNYVSCKGFVEEIGALSLPSDVEVLDLSGISLRSIPSYHFMDQSLVKIEKLDLSRNNLTHIYPDIFVGLNDLNILDLSYNQIVYFDPHSLIYNDFLTHLVLKGTHLPVSDSSLVISRSLQVLDVSECGIEALPYLTLSEIPYLKILNISENPLSIIDPKVLDNLTWLKQLDITRTNIRCDHRLAALSEWGKESAVEITGYPCLNSHSLQGHSYRNFRRRTTEAENGPEWATPNPVDEELHENESIEALQTDEVATVMYPEDGDSSAYDDIEDSAEDADFPSADPAEPAENHPSDLRGSTLYDSLAKVHWTIWLSCAGGFGLGVALTIGLGFAVNVCCCRQPDDSNELVSAGEDFQLVDSPVDEGPIIRDQPPSYSSLFSSRPHKVLPTIPVRENRGVR